MGGTAIGETLNAEIVVVADVTSNPDLSGVSLCQPYGYGGASQTRDIDVLLRLYRPNTRRIHI